MQQKTVDNIFYLQLTIIVSLIFLLITLLQIFYENYIQTRSNLQHKYNLIQDPYSPPFYYINLDKSINRKQRYEERLSKYLNISIERIPAITPHDIDNFQIEIPASCQYNSPVEIACTLSHLKAIFTAYKNLIYNISKKKSVPMYALITEDDLIILEMPDWNELIASAPRDWEILQLVASGYLAEHMYNQQLDGWQKHLQDMWCCAAYLINLQGMEKILSLCIPEYKTIDNWNDLSFINLNYKKSNCAADHLIYSIAKTYTFTQPIFNVEGIDSTIHSHHLPLHHNTINTINNRFKLRVRNDTDI